MDNSPVSYMLVTANVGSVFEDVRMFSRKLINSLFLFLVRDNNVMPFYFWHNIDFFTFTKLLLYVCFLKAYGYTAKHLQRYKYIYSLHRFIDKKNRQMFSFVYFVKNKNWDEKKKTHFLH